MSEELRQELHEDGIPALLDHLRSCGAMPEMYGHDSSEEKLYAKYTDAVLAHALIAIGLNCTVLSARADAADVQGKCAKFSLVADAKAFRLSRTAKNQKDFKVQALDGWRRDLDYALVVCPIYQLPSSASQIYQQAISRNVCILSYSHLAVLVELTRIHNGPTVDALEGILRSVAALHPTKNARDYWAGLNRSLLTSVKGHEEIWSNEKVTALEVLTALKAESLQYLASERDRVLGLSHEQALEELVRRTGLGARIATVQRVRDNGMLEV